MKFVNWLRFMKASDRLPHSIFYQLGQEYHQTIRYAKWHFHKWKGLTLMKDPMCLSVYMMMLQEIKPKTIIEFGTYDGGSALWMSDIMKSLGCKCDIHTFDINIQRVNLPLNSGVTVNYLNNYDIKNFVAQKRNFFKNMKSPVLMIEDSHENVNELVRTIDPFLNSGDYVIIEDTIGPKKYKEIIEEGMSKMDYDLDTYYCDFWGYNNSCNVNSIFKKC